MRRGELVRLVIGCAAAGLLCVGAAACGGSKASTDVRTGATANQTASLGAEKLDADKDTDGVHPDEDELSGPPPSDRDGDGDAGPGGAKHRYDSDDLSTIDFGHPASRAQAALITPLVRRYYAIADAQNGGGACALLYSTFAEAVPEDYGTSPPGPAFARGATCPAVMTAVFKHYHDEIAFRLPRLRIERVRVSGRHGVVVLRFGGNLPERELDVEREGSEWKVLALVDNRLR